MYKKGSLLLFIFLMGVLSVTAQKVTLKFKNAELKQVFSEINRQTGYVFSYSNQVVNTKQKVHITTSDEELKSVLKKMFSATSITYEIINGKKIILTRKKEAKAYKYRKIEGKVYSNMGVIPGASVVIKGTYKGTVTDLNGYFSISSKTGDVLEFSYLGMLDQKVSVENSTKKLTIILQEDIQNLDEVVITGLQIKKKKREVGYAVQEIKNEELTQAKAHKIVDAIAGKVSGVKIIASPTMKFEDDSQILLRGINTLNPSYGETIGLYDPNPLYVIDGIPSSLSKVDMNDIAKITVLKGTAATSLYGSNGANGVILITTKSATIKGVYFNLSTSITQLNLEPEYQNVYGGGNSSEFIKFKYNPSKHPKSWKQFEGQKIIDYNAKESWGPKMDGTPIRQWYSWYEGTLEYGKLTPFNPTNTTLKDFYRTGILTDLNVSVTNKINQFNYRISYTNRKNEGVVLNTKNVKNSLGLSIDTQVGKLQVETKFSYNKSQQDGAYGAFTGSYSGNGVLKYHNKWQRQLDINRLKKVYSSNGKELKWSLKNPMYKYFNYDQFMDDYSVGRNEFLSYEETFKEVQSQNLLGSINLKYDFNKNSSITAIVGQSNSNTMNRLGSNMKTAKEGYGEYAETHSESKSTFARATLNYNTELLKNLNMNFNVGTTYERSSTYSLGATVTALKAPKYYSLLGGVAGKLSFSSYAMNSLKGRSDYRNARQLSESFSVYGSATLSYKNWLYVTTTLRNDWSSRLFKENNSYNYPSLSSSFIFSELLPKNNILNYGQFRVSWAKSGTTPTAYINSLIYNYKEYGTTGGSYPKTLKYQDLPGELWNSSLKSGVDNSIELGLNMNFFDSRVGFDIAYYNRISENKIMTVTIPASSGGYGRGWINAGKITNKGYELSVNANPIRGDFNWNFYANISKNTPFIDELTEGVEKVKVTTYAYAIAGKKWGILDLGEYKSALRFYNYKKDEKGKTARDRGGNPIILPHESNGKRVVNVSYNKDGTIKYKEGSPYNFIGKSQKSDNLQDNAKDVSILPDFTGGFTNGLSYKGFRLNFSLDFQIGGKFAAETLQNADKYGLSVETTGNNDKGNPVRNPLVAKDGSTTYSYYGTPKPYLGIPASEAAENTGGVRVDAVDKDGKPVSLYVRAREYYQNNRWLEDYLIDASYLKLREVSLGYTFNKIPRINSLYVSVFGRNLGFIYKDKRANGIDPTMVTLGGAYSSYYPEFAVYGLNLNLNF